jgi:hypothetical protein
VGVAQPDVTQPPQKKTELPEARWIEGDASSVSLEVMVMVLRTVSAPSSSVVGGGVVLVERPRQGGSLARGAGTEPSQTPVRMGTNRPRLELADLLKPEARRSSSMTLRRRRNDATTTGSWEA